MEVEELVGLLSNIQFKQSLDWVTYVIILCSSGLGVFLGAYFKESGKQYATTDNFDELKAQLEETTSIVEDVKTKVSERTWVNQQIWVKKQEAYESIFESLFHIRKYVSHQVEEYEEWEQLNHHYPELAYEQHDDGKLTRIWELEKEEYEKKAKDPETVASAQKLKTKYENSFESLFRVIEVKSIYLDSDVDVTIAGLKSELGITNDYEGWDEHFFRIEKFTDSSIEKIKVISKTELKIET